MKKIFLYLVMLVMFTMISVCDKEVRVEDYYTGNIKTRVFHRRGCIYYKCYHCTVHFRTREEAIKAGYRPCLKCNP